MPSTVKPIADSNLDPPVRGFLHFATPANRSSQGAPNPAVSNGDGLVLTHGAGGNSQSPLLVSLAEALAGLGVSVLRCDLPFRQKRPHGPPSPSGSERDRAGLANALSVLGTVAKGRLFLGGQSYGGRQASMLAAAEPDLVSGLLLLSYPLHPPGRPAQKRTEHLPQLSVPVLFVSGTADAFGSIEELDEARKLIPARTHLLPIPGAGHSLLTKQNRAELPRLIAEAFAQMFRLR